jgi:hypothetical protein
MAFKQIGTIEKIGQIKLANENPNDKRNRSPPLAEHLAKKINAMKTKIDQINEMPMTEAITEFLLFATV